MQNKKVLTLSILLLIVIVAVFLFKSYSKNNITTDNIGKSEATDLKDATYIIDGKPVTLGSKLNVITSYFGNEVKNDFDGDGRQDTAFIITQNTGGSGTFYYVVIALNTARGYVGSEGFLLGDRIAPQTTEMSQNSSTPDVVVVNYADRKIGEPFVTKPSVGKSVWLKLDTNTMQFGEVVQNFEGESDKGRVY